MDFKENFKKITDFIWPFKILRVFLDVFGDCVDAFLSVGWQWVHGQI